MIKKELIDFANHLADLSSKVIKNYYRVSNDEIAKTDDSPVTRADREAEAVMRAAIEKTFPEDGIIGEEFGIKESKSGFNWILDPIDGTSSFIIGRPIFGTLIALTQNEESLIGIVNQPITNERWLGIKGGGAFFNGNKIQVRDCGNLENAVMCSSSSFYFQGDDAEVLRKITSKTKYQKLGGIIYGGDCYSYACLASGFVDAVIDPGLKVYDYAPNMILIKEAGGIITNWQGSDPKLQSGVKLIACGSAKIHQEILEIINS